MGDTATRDGAVWDVLILGAGAAGMFCAAEAAAGGLRVLTIDHAKAPGEKIRISGGGRCNFTNIHARPDRFISANPHFARSALARYTAQDFVELVERHRIPFHEKTLGQLFCDRSARDVIAMLRDEMDRVDAALRLRTSLVDLRRDGGGFDATLETEGDRWSARAARVVVATGGKSIPKMGATGLGYRLAEQFGLPIEPTRPGLAPLTFTGATLDRLKALAGVAAPCVARAGGAAFQEAALFTHRGLSGPAVLQVSSYWREGDAIEIGFAERASVFDALRAARAAGPKRTAATALSDGPAAGLPKRLAQTLCAVADVDGPLGPQSDKALDRLASVVAGWRLTPAGSEGYRTAEVTIGGVSTAALDAKTMEARDVPGLYFIGEVVDVTGWLGGYNFQWAWSSASACGRAIAEAGRSA